jgi:hypothetical protein
MSIELKEIHEPFIEALAAYLAPLCASGHDLFIGAMEVFDAAFLARPGLVIEGLDEGAIAYSDGYKDPEFKEKYAANSRNRRKHVEEIVRSAFARNGYVCNEVDAGEFNHGGEDDWGFSVSVDAFEEPPCTGPSPSAEEVPPG